MVNAVIGLIIAVILLGAVVYICSAKKSGRKCIGCPGSKCCMGSCDYECEE